MQIELNDKFLVIVKLIKQEKSNNIEEFRVNRSLGKNAQKKTSRLFA